MIKQSVLQTFNSFLVSTKKVFVWWMPELQCFSPMPGNVHSLQSFWRCPPSSSAPCCNQKLHMNAVPFLLLPPMKLFITWTEEFDWEWDTETYLLPANCFHERDLGKGKWQRAIQHSSTRSRHSWGKKKQKTKGKRKKAKSSTNNSVF